TPAAHMKNWQPRGTPSPVSAFLSSHSKRESISPLHIVEPHSRPTLEAFLSSRGLKTHSALLGERGFVRGEWMGEHAASQLSAESGCESTPAWIVWLLPPPHHGTHLVLSLWAQDGRAARRALLALPIRHATYVHIVLPRACLQQLERFTHELEDAELLQMTHHPAELLLPEALHPEALNHTEASATLVMRAGEQLETLHRERAAHAMDDEELVMRRLQELSRRLLLLDPKAEIDVAPKTTSATGRSQLAILAVRLNGHVMSWGGEIDRLAIAPLPFTIFSTP
ncbi:MAG: hypothetical protein SGPRY_007936, partial [Prymnesium sp.]